MRNGLNRKLVLGFAVAAVVVLLSASESLAGGRSSVRVVSSSISRGTPLRVDTVRDRRASESSRDRDIWRASEISRDRDGIRHYQDMRDFGPSRQRELYRQPQIRPLAGRLPVYSGSPTVIVVLTLQNNPQVVFTPSPYRPARQSPVVQFILRR